MKAIKKYFVLPVLAILLTACGEDRTYEYLEKTEENQWIYSQMKEHYLWADSIATPKRNSFFSKSSDFFYSLLMKDDRTSFFSDSATQTSYGMSFAIMRDPLNIKPSNSYALVLFVEPGSPAYSAGVKRGMWISRVGNNNITSSNYGYLERGAATTICTWSIKMDEETMEYVWVQGDTLSIGQAEPLEPTAIYIDTTYTLRDHKIGYIVYNRFKADDASNIQNALLRFTDKGVTDLIIDLRYNSGGSLNTASAIASNLVSPAADGKTFCKVVHNTANSDKDIVYTYKNSSAPFETGMIYIITTQATRGAAETFATSLRATLGMEHVAIVGSSSANDNLYSQTFESTYGFTINPTTGYIYTPNGNTFSAQSAEPDYFVDELAQLYTIYQLGEEQEYMLYSVMHLIANGILPYTQHENNIDALRYNTLQYGKSITK